MTPSVLSGLHTAERYLTTLPTTPLPLPDDPGWIDGFLTRVLTTDLDALPAHRLQFTGSAAVHYQLISVAREFGYHSLPPALHWVPPHE